MENLPAKTNLPKKVENLLAKNEIKVRPGDIILDRDGRVSRIVRITSGGIYRQDSDGANAREY